MVALEIGMMSDPNPNTVFSSYAPDRIDLFIDSIRSKSSVSGVLM